jgi:hypothetical protein
MMCLDDEIRHRHHRQSSRLSDDKSDDAMEERDTYSHTPLLQDTWKSRNHGRNCRNAAPETPGWSRHYRFLEKRGSCKSCARIAK